MRTAIVFAFVCVLFCFFLFFKKAHTANECTLEWFSQLHVIPVFWVFLRGGVGSYFPYIRNDGLTTCKVISKCLASRFVY